ncbi:hypothetical protein BY996DRAFT_6423370 [Phakopsora pachyrhizi]|nr:hypothetical protein BY996DRAFT_6423370 [Phakopsora pachyrhizi]
MSTLRTEEEKTVWNSPEKLTVIKIKVILKKFNIQFNRKHLRADLVELYIDLASRQCPEIASSWKSKSMPVLTRSPSPYARSNSNVCRELLRGWLPSKRFNIRELKSILDFYEVPYPNPPRRPDVVNLYEALKSEENPELNPPSDRKTRSTSAGKLKSNYLLAHNHSKKEDEEDHNNSSRKEKMKPTLVIARTITPKPRTLSKRKKVQVNTDKKPAKKPRLGGSLGLEGTVLIESLRNLTSDPTNLPLQSGSQSNATLLALDPSKAKQQNSLSHHWPSESGKAIVTPSKVTMSLNPVDLQQAKGQSLVQEKIITGALDSSIDSSKKQKSSGIERPLSESMTTSELKKCLYNNFSLKNLSNDRTVLVGLYKQLVLQKTKMPQQRKLKRQITICFSPGEEVNPKDFSIPMPKISKARKKRHLSIYTCRQNQQFLHPISQQPESLQGQTPVKSPQYSTPNGQKYPLEIRSPLSTHPTIDSTCLITNTISSDSFQALTESNAPFASLIQMEPQSTLTKEPDCCSLARLTNSAKISDKKHDYEENVANTIINGITSPPVAPHILLEGHKNPTAATQNNIEDLWGLLPQSMNGGNLLLAAVSDSFSKPATAAQNVSQGLSVYNPQSTNASNQLAGALPVSWEDHNKIASTNLEARAQTISQELSSFSSQFNDGGDIMHAAVSNYSKTYSEPAATAQIFNQDQSVSKSQYMDGSIHFAKSGVGETAMPQAANLSLAPNTHKSAKESESTAGPSTTAPNIPEAHNKPTAATQTIIEDLLGLSPQSMNGGNPMFAAVPNVRSENFETLGSNLTIGNDISPPKHQTPKDAQIFEGATSFRQIHDLSIDRGNSQLISLNRQKSSKRACSDSLVWPVTAAMTPPPRKKRKAFRANREDQLLISAAIMSTKRKGKKCAAPFFSSRLKSQDDINFSIRGAGTSEQAIDQLHYRESGPLPQIQCDSLMKNQDFQNATKHQYSLDDWAGKWRRSLMLMSD